MSHTIVDEQLAEQFSECPKSGVGSRVGGLYSRNKFINSQEEQNCTVNISEDNIQLYGLFCGFDNGLEAARYAMNRMVYEVFRDQPINRSMQPEQVIDSLRKKFKIVDERFNNSMEPYLSERFILKDMGLATHNERISELDEKIRGGCSVLIVLRIDSNIYTLNCGTSQAIVVTGESSRPAFCLNEPVHDNQNQLEIDRLTAIGVDPNKVHGPTRAIGDFFRSSLYQESPCFENARGPPVIAEPDILHMKLKPSWRYIILISDGVVHNLKEAEVEDIPFEIFDKFPEEHTPTSTAQGLVDHFGRKHKEAHSKHVQEVGEPCTNNSRQEMTIICVKLPTEVSFISSLDSSSSSAANSLVRPNLDPIIPYVDLDFKYSDKLIHLVEHLLLPEHS